MFSTVLIRLQFNLHEKYFNYDIEFKIQVETLNLQVKALTVEIREVKGDNAIKRREISRIKLGIDALKQKVSNLFNLLSNNILV